MQVAPVSTTGPPQFHSLTTPVHTQSGGPPIPPHYPAGSSAQNPSTDTRRGESEKHYFLSASPHGWSEVISLHIPAKSFLWSRWCARGDNSHGALASLQRKCDQASRLRGVCSFSSHVYSVRPGIVHWHASVVTWISFLFVSKYLLQEIDKSTGRHIEPEGEREGQREMMMYLCVRGKTERQNQWRCEIKEEKSVKAELGDDNRENKSPFWQVVESWVNGKPENNKHFIFRDRRPRVVKT